MRNMDEELDYISSSPLLATEPKKVKSQDEIDLPTLKRVQKMLEEQIESYRTIDRLVLKESELSVKEQLAVNKAVSFHLSEVKLMIDTVINNIKEKYSE